MCTTGTVAVRAICTRDIDLEALGAGPEAAPLVRFIAGAVARDPQQRYPDANALLVLATVLVAGVGLGTAAKRLGLPRVTGQILAGLLIGHAGLCAERSGNSCTRTHTNRFLNIPMKRIFRSGSSKLSSTPR